MAGGVADDRLPEFGGEQVAGVLCDRRQAAPAFARGLCESVEEARPGRFAHQEPGFVDEHAAFAQALVEAAPDRVEAEQQGDGFESFGETAQREADEFPLRLHACRRVEQCRERAGRVGGEAFGEPLPATAALLELGWRIAQQRRRVVGVGGLRGLVERGEFGR